MSKFITISDAREAGRAMGERLTARDHDLDLDFTNLMQEINDANAEDIDTTTLASLLSLPDDQFNILAPVFLDELEKSYNNTNNQMLILRALNVTGKTVEEVREEYEMLCDEIDTTMQGLSIAKISFMKSIMGLFYNTVSAMDGIEKQVLTVPIEICNEDAKLPAYAHLSDSGMDVYATEDITIHPGQTKLIPLGIKVAIPKGYELQVRPKSGRSLKSKLRIANAPGTIDSGYRDEVGIIVDNIDQFITGGELDEQGRLCAVAFGSDITIGKGEKFAQLVLARVPKVAWVEVGQVLDGEDRGGGFGSTGLK